MGVSLLVYGFTTCIQVYRNQRRVSEPQKLDYRWL